MATRRTAGMASMGALIGLTIFAILTVLFLATTVLFYTQLNKERERNARSGDAMATFADDKDQQSGAYQQMQREFEASGKKKTVYKQLLEREMASRLPIVGNPNATLDQMIQDLRSKWRPAIETVNTIVSRDQALTEDAVVVEAIEKMAHTIKMQREQLATLKTKLSQVDADLVTARKQVDAKQKALDDQKGTLDSELKAVSDKVTSGEEQTRNMISAHAKEVTDKFENLEKDRARLIAELSRMDELVRSKEREMQQLIAELKSIRRNRPNTIYEVDGQVLSVNPAEKTVTIDLGSQDRLMLGMQFEVFGKDEGVSVDTRLNRIDRGRATVEVVNLRPDTALCRVIRQSFGQPIQVGDLIANIAYDKNKTYKFVVFGDFDIDGDLRATAFDMDQVVAMIKRYGGKTEKISGRGVKLGGDELMITPDSDYLVVGMAPKLPEPPMDPNDPDVMAIHEAEVKKYQQYQALVKQAMKLGIPVLNQNRFLSLVGFYRQ